MAKAFPPRPLKRSSELNTDGIPSAVFTLSTHRR